MVSAEFYVSSKQIAIRSADDIDLRIGGSVEVAVVEIHPVSMLLICRISL